MEIEKETNIPTSEAYLEPSRTSTTDYFCENSQRLKVVNYFCKKSSITDVRLGSKYTSIPDMTYVSKACVSSKKMFAGLAHKKYLKRTSNGKNTTKKQTCLPNMAFLSNQI